MSEPVTPEQRRQDFIAATELLGGQRATAALLEISERTIRGMVSGDRHIHDGFMADITTALYDRERQCRELAKRIDPLFVANRIPAPPRGGASHIRNKANG